MSTEDDLRAKSEDDLRGKIEGLENKKSGLIDRIKQLNKRVRYKEYEKKALEPFIEETKGVVIAPLRKQKRKMEFKISTAAYTPRMEKELLKEMKKIDEELEKVKEVERARRKIRYVEKDIEDGKGEITQIETELKVIRDELKKLYDSLKGMRLSSKRMGGPSSQAETRSKEDDFVALGDLAMIEKE